LISQKFSTVGAAFDVKIISDDRIRFITGSIRRVERWQWQCWISILLSKRLSLRLNKGTHSVAVSSLMVHTQNMLARRTLVGAILLFDRIQILWSRRQPSLKILEFSLAETGLPTARE
jgi:hypothetical protein